MSEIRLGTDQEHAEHRRKVMNEEWEATRELMAGEALPAVVEKNTSIVRAAVGDVAEAIHEYTRIQAQIDKALPDCTMQIRGKLFRKKSYWRAVATAFNLTLENMKEQLDETEGGSWGYLVTYRATAPNGRFADGDGACYASEKSEEQATVHNVRGHAHTRAMNRAISNLVGFGEVSAEEVVRDPPVRGEQRSQAQGEQGNRSSGARNAPRTGAGPTPIATEDGIPLTKEMLELPWLDEPLGFGKHKDATWRTFCGGGMGSGRISYLGWFLEQEHKSDRQRETAEKARTVCRLVEAREMEQARKAQDQADDPAWEK